ncbi:MAG: hypothetical protein H6822_29995 [Planctomycetaceae bacterium]|nr:hypothetical protein [Planctomycetaceae bacterium]
MPLEEITGTRDLTFSRWHRSLPADCSWIDIDCCHYCQYCNSLLALFELVRCPDETDLAESCRRKIAAITERVGRRLEIPVFKIAYTGEPLQAAAVMRVNESKVLVMQPSELARFINQLHDCEFCRRHRGGRFKDQ